MKNTVNISDISDELAEEVGISKLASKGYTDKIFELIKKHLENGEEVKVNMFGKFDMVVSAPKKSKLAADGTAVPAKHRIKYTMSRALVKSYNSSD